LQHLCNRMQENLCEWKPITNENSMMCNY
jgi:hypothetical protein